MSYLDPANAIRGRYNGYACPLCQHLPQYANGPTVAGDTEGALKTHMYYAHSTTHGAIFREGTGWDCPIWDCQQRFETFDEFRLHSDREHMHSVRAFACSMCPEGHVNRYGDGMALAIHQKIVHPRRYRKWPMRASAQLVMVEDDKIEGKVEELFRQEEEEGGDEEEGELIDEAPPSSPLNGSSKKRKTRLVLNKRVFKRRMPVKVSLLANDLIPPDDEDEDYQPRQVLEEVNPGDKDPPGMRMTFIDCDDDLSGSWISSSSNSNSTGN